METISADILSKIKRRQQKLEQNEIVDIQTRNDVVVQQQSANATGEFPDREMGFPEEEEREMEGEPEERELTLADLLEVESLGTSGYHTGESQIDEAEAEKYEREAIQRELEAAERHQLIQQRIQERRRTHQQAVVSAKLQHSVVDLHYHHSIRVEQRPQPLPQQVVQVMQDEGMQMLEQMKPDVKAMIHAQLLAENHNQYHRSIKENIEEKVNSYLRSGNL